MKGLLLKKQIMKIRLIKTLKTLPKTAKRSKESLGTMNVYFKILLMKMRKVIGFLKCLPDPRKESTKAMKYRHDLVIILLILS